MKNKNAQSLAKLRWDKTTPEERKEYSKMLLKKRKKFKEGVRKRNSKGHFV